MPVIGGSEVEDLIELLSDRGVNLYHACQYKDFKSYMDLDCLPSRNLLATSWHAYTEFDTDDTDRRNGVWVKVFANLSDFGIPFAQLNWGKFPVPNPYGPILLIFDPAVLNEAEDIAIGPLGQSILIGMLSP
jgi:hypothetical protein